MAQRFKFSFPIGSGLTDWFVNKTIGKHFTAGQEIESVRQRVLECNSSGFFAMVAYLAELKPGQIVPETVNYFFGKKF